MLSSRYIRDPWLDPRVKQASQFREEQLSAELAAELAAELVPELALAFPANRRGEGRLGAHLQGLERQTVLPPYPSRLSSPTSSSSSGSSCSDADDGEDDLDPSRPSPARQHGVLDNDPPGGGGGGSFDELAWMFVNLGYDSNSKVTAPGPLPVAFPSQPQGGYQQQQPFSLISQALSEGGSPPRNGSMLRKRDNEDDGDDVSISKRLRAGISDHDRGHEALRFACPLQAVCPRLHCFSPPANPHGGCPSISKLTYVLFVSTQML